MTQLNALSLADSLRKRMVDFALDDNFVNDPELTDICRVIWGGAPNEGGLVSDMWVEGAFPSKTSAHSLDDLVAEGMFDANLRDVLDKPSAMPRDRRLYTHQRDSIVRAQRGTDGELPSIVVTAGTGAGKTESFLLPILNDLYRSAPQDAEGVKCIILYPMNALVNDQVDRLYEWMKGQNKVTLFHFTSETPEDARRANNDNVPTWEACRMRTRQQARGIEDGDGKKIPEDERGPTPDIVITNYSMLEYMLCRPQDAIFFGPALRHIVLDEAHLYTGTLAAEITLLLRRLVMRCGVKPENVQHFATSATLGTGNTDELLDFAAQVFSKPKRLIHVLEGEYVQPALDEPEPPSTPSTASVIAEVGQLDGPTIVENIDGEQELAEWTEGQIDGLKHGLRALASANRLNALDTGERRPACVLNHALKAAPLLHKLQSILWNRKHVPLNELAAELFGDRSDQSVGAAVALLHLAASARGDVKSYPLVPHRIHILARPTDGLSVCLNSGCDAPNERRLHGLGGVMSGCQDACVYCQSVVLSLFRCHNCGQWMLAGRKSADGEMTAERETGPLKASTNNKGTLLMRPGLSASKPKCNVKIGVGDGRIRGAGATTEGVFELHAIDECPRCGSETDGENVRVRSFSMGTGVAIPLVAETILSEMPEFPSKGQGGNTWLPANGRRLLAFSDSRREAARLGVQLTSQHETQVVRSTIAKMMQDEPLNPDRRLRRIRRDISRYEEDLREPDLDRDERNDIERDLDRRRRQLAEITAGGSIDDWSRRLGERREMNQLLHRDTSDGHEARSWKQMKWEDNGRHIRKNAKAYIAKEFATSALPGSAALEALGLAEVTYPEIDSIGAHNGFIGTLPTEAMRQSLADNWGGLLAALCDTLRQGRVITLGEDLDNSYDFDSIPIAQWASKSTDDGYELTRFVGASSRQRRMRFAMNVLKRAGFPSRDDEALEQKAGALLEACFDQLEVAAKDDRIRWIETSGRETYAGGTVPAIRLVFDHLGLRRPSTLFRCKKTGLVWVRSVLGCAPADGAVDTLEPRTHEELDRDARMGRRRREYQTSEIFGMGLWSEEHSAQLDPKENRRLQDLFKSGVRNILSATTTLELGIDIGGLNGVLMGNVPPGKANYLQRAGRAGRRADGSSVVVGFARPRPFDREVFNRIGDYLGSPLRKPVVFLDRERVVRRHLHALLLNEFFHPATSGGRTGAMDSFGRMGEFCGVQQILRPDREGLRQLQPSDSSAKSSDGFSAFLEDMRQNGNDRMRRQTERLLKDTGLEDASKDWTLLLGEAIEQFKSAVSRWRTDYDPLIEAYSELLNEERHTSEVRSQAWAIYYQARKLRDVTVIEALADRQFMPRYGFPIGVQKLNVLSYDDRRDREINEDQYRLERPSLLALREYVPGSKLLVGGKLITSHGLMKHWTGAQVDDSVGFRGLYAQCLNEHVYYWSGANNTKKPCSVCDEQAASSPREFMFPTHGFTTASWDPPKWSSNIEIVGEAETVAKTFVSAEEGVMPRKDFGGVRGLVAYYKEDGELLVYNEGKERKGFAFVCSAAMRTVNETLAMG